MSLQTIWGYSLEGVDSLAAMMTAEEFNTMTANKFSGDARISGALAAACMGIRNYCGWHIYPAESCRFADRLYNGNGRIKVVDRDLLIQLPSTYVTGITSVAIDGGEWINYAVETNGLARLFGAAPLIDSHVEIVIVYTAGLPAGLMDGIKEVVAGRVTKALSSTNGVSSESAGGVSISYNSGWVNGSAGAMQSADAEILEPYRLQGVF